jgi:ribonuclease HII
MTLDRSCILPSLEFESLLWKNQITRVAGIDEAGRGAWAGPVCAAAVILPTDPSIIQRLYGVRDSKLMTPNARQAWAPQIRKEALAWGVGFASVEEIDSLGILPATKLAALRALGALEPDHLLTDLLVFRELSLPQTALVHGDRISLSIAAASVLAKTTRDDFMGKLDKQVPGYAFTRHKGYGTRLHRLAITQQGLSAVHRRSFSIRLGDS